MVVVATRDKRIVKSIIEMGKAGMTWITILVSVLGALGIPSVISFLVTRHFNKKDKKDEKYDDAIKRLETVEQKESNCERKYTIESGRINEELSDIKKTLKFLTSGEQAILRDRIIHAYNHYYKEKKFMPIYARESLDHMYQEYHNLGGNGVVEDLIKKLYQLPTEPEEPYIPDDVYTDD
jgi:hypothetical protein